jgi:hypothetical protein
MNKYVFVTSMTLINPVTFFFCFQYLQVSLTLRHLFAFFTWIKVLLRIEITRILFLSLWICHVDYDCYKFDEKTNLI